MASLPSLCLQAGLLYWAGRGGSCVGTSFQCRWASKTTRKKSLQTELLPCALLARCEKVQGLAGASGWQPQPST